MAANVREAFVSLLRNGDAQLTALIGARVYFEVLPEEVVFPCLVLDTITDSDEIAQDGRSGLCRVRIQVRACGLKYTDADAVARRVKVLCSAFKGTVDGYLLGPIFYLTRFDFREGSENVFQAIADFYVWCTD